jgi:hypothetical protein
MYWFGCIVLYLWFGMHKSTVYNADIYSLANLHGRPFLLQSRR